MCPTLLARCAHVRAPRASPREKGGAPWPAAVICCRSIIGSLDRETTFPTNLGARTPASVLTFMDPVAEESGLQEVVGAETVVSKPAYARTTVALISLLAVASVAGVALWIEAPVNHTSAALGEAHVPITTTGERMAPTDHMVGAPPETRRASDVMAPAGSCSGFLEPGLYACSGDVDDGELDPTSDGCQGCRPPSVWTSLIDWFRDDRRFLVAVPPAAASQAVPLVIVAPGTNRNEETMLEVTGLEPLGQDQGFAVLVLKGRRDRLNVGKDAQADPDDTDDVAYALAAIRHANKVVGSNGIDPSRIFCTGHSRGGRFCSLLASKLSSVIAAIAPVGGLRYPVPNLASRPVPVISFHGLDDEVNPYDGGGGECAALRRPTGVRLSCALTSALRPFPRPLADWGTSVPDALAGWSLFNGCSASQTLADPHPGVHLATWTDCDEEAEVISYTVEDGGHTWPGSDFDFGWREGAEMPLPKATELMLLFFDRHPLGAATTAQAAALITG